MFNILKPSVLFHRSSTFSSVLLHQAQQCTKSFCTAATPPPPSKYSEKYQLSDAEISAVLKTKPKKQKQNLVFATEIQPDTAYDKDIKETLQQLSEQQKPYAERNTTDISDVQDDHDVPDNNASAGSAITTGMNASGKVQIKYYKYELPIPNIDPDIQGIVDPFERAKQQHETPNQRLWQLLNLNENTPYEAYELSLRHKFNNEVDMYGDIQDEALIRADQQKAMGDGAIPMFHLNSPAYMDRMRRQLSVNFNMPGSIELEHPHKFLKDLRPIEEFRHTPLIPISDRQMKEHQQKVEALSRQGFYFEVKKDTVYNWILAGVAISIGFYMITIIVQKEEETGIAVERLKIERSNIGIVKKN